MFNLFQDKADINIQSTNTEMMVRWTGFHHPSLSLTYVLSIHDESNATIAISDNVIGQEFLFTSLQLQNFRVRLITV